MIAQKNSFRFYNKDFDYLSHYRGKKYAEVFRRPQVYLVLLCDCRGCKLVAITISSRISLFDYMLYMISKLLMRVHVYMCAYAVKKKVLKSPFLKVVCVRNFLT